jgi:hypothetical protein
VRPPCLIRPVVPYENVCTGLCNKKQLRVLGWSSAELVARGHGVVETRRIFVIASGASYKAEVGGSIPPPPTNSDK